MERQMARRAAKVRRQRQLWAGLIVGLVAILGITGTVWALGGFSPSKKPPAPAACNWADTGAGNAKLKNVGKPPTSGEPRSGTETMTITTSLGVITAKLDLAKSPCTAASFAYLAGKNFFANTKCHKLTTAGKFLLECGDPNPNPTGDGGPTYTYANEYIPTTPAPAPSSANPRSEEHTSELQSQSNLVCRLLLEKKNPSTRAGYGPVNKQVAQKAIAVALQLPHRPPALGHDSPLSLVPSIVRQSLPGAITQHVIP